MKSILGRRVALLVVCLAVAAGVGLVSARNVSRQLEVIEACDAVAGADWSAVLAGTDGPLGDDETGRAALECRCTALLATGAGSTCVELLEAAVQGGEDGGWIPSPELTVHLIQTWRDRARIDAAARLARRAAKRFPKDPNLFYLELETRSSVENEEAVMQELRARIPATGSASVRMRISLANRYLSRGDAKNAIAVLGNDIPEGAGAAADLWFDTRGMALAAHDDIEGVIAHYERWRRAGGKEVELAARYALTLSMTGLADPRATPGELLGRAWARMDELSDPQLQEALAIRLILTRVNEGSHEKAIAVYDDARERFEMIGLSRDELQRAAAHRLLRLSPGEKRKGTIRLVVRDPQPGDHLLISPDEEAPADAEFSSFALPENGRLEIDRTVGTAPLQWVHRDADRNVLGSGTAHPAAGSVVAVDIETKPPLTPETVTLERRAADGRRRVFLLLLDCGDWRIVQYLRARGELPTLGALLQTGVPRRAGQRPTAHRGGARGTGMAESAQRIFLCRVGSSHGCRTRRPRVDRKKSVRRTRMVPPRNRGSLFGSRTRRSHGGESTARTRQHSVREARRNHGAARETQPNVDLTERP